MDPLADFVGLTDVALRRRREPAHGLFVAEGVQTVVRALAAGYRPRTLVVSTLRAERPDVRDLVERVGGCGGHVLVVEPERLSAVAGFDVHRGVLGSFARRRLPSVPELVAPARTVAVLEGIVDHTNVGAVFRSAVALGADGIVLDPRCADPLYRRAVRTSMGAVFAAPWTRCPTWPAGLAEIRALGCRVLALTPSAGATDLADLAVGPDEQVAVLLGAEGSGLSREAVRQADEAVVVGMAHGVDSLNVATCAAVAFWALARARDRGTPESLDYAPEA